MGRSQGEPVRSRSWIPALRRLSGHVECDHEGLRARHPPYVPRRGHGRRSLRSAKPRPLPDQAGFKAREEKPEGRNLIPLSERDKQISAHLEGIADKKSVPLLGVALAYVIQKAPHVFPIVGGRRVEHIKGSIDALVISLTEEEIEDVEAAYEFDHGFPHTFLSGTLIKGETPKTADRPDDAFLTKTLGTFDWVQQSAATRPSP